MKTFHRIAAAVIGVLAAGMMQAGAAEKWVDINAEPGGDGSQSRPYQQIKDITQAMVTSDMIVHIAGGTYQPVLWGNAGGTQTIHYKGEGTEENPVIIDAGNASPCLSFANYSNSDKRLKVENIVFTNGCFSSRGSFGTYGGAIQWRYITSIVGCTFVDCNATNAAKTACGGAIGCPNGSFAVSNCVFRNCTASKNGGAVYTDREARTILSGCTFEGCKAATGGAVYLSRLNTFAEDTICGSDIYDCTFTNNTTTGSYSALYGVVNRCEMSRFFDNRATGSGLWGINDKCSNDKQYVQTNTFVACTFRGNMGANCALFYGAEETAGVKRKRVWLEDCTIEDNVSTGGGCIAHGHVNFCWVRNSAIRRNSGKYLFCPSGFASSTEVFGLKDFNFQFAGTTIASNHTASAMIATGRDRMLVDGCQFLTNACSQIVSVNNVADASAYTNVVRNCLFDGNVAASTLLETFWGQSQSFQLCNNTFVNNRAGAANATTGIITSLGNAMEFKNYGLILANNIIYGNRRLDGSVGNQCGTRWWDYSNNDWLEADGWVDTNKHTPIPSGVRGNVVAADPKFKVEGDDKYLPGSACRNKGQEYAWMANATDLRGKPRIVGDAPDMGCYEAVPSGLLLLLR